MASLIWLTLAFAAWGFLHSWLASPFWKAWLQTRWGERWMVRYYRLAYNAFALLSFLPLMWLVVALPDRLIYRLPYPWALLAVLVQMGGMAIIAWAVQQTDAWAFLGVRQAWSGQEPAEKFTADGPYRWVRHPIYTGTLLLLWFSPIATRNQWMFNTLATLYIFIGAYFEERKLLRLFGERYRRYRQQTPMLFPRLRSKKLAL